MVRPASEPTLTEPERALAQAAVDILDELDAPDVLSALTAERVAERSGYSPSSVRYQLSQGRREAAEGSRWSHDRERLLLLVAHEVAERLMATTELSVQAYFAGIEALVKTGDPSVITAVITQDMDGFTPGATEEDFGGSAERALFMLIAAADGAPGASRILKAGQDEQMRAYIEPLKALLKVSGRQVREESDYYTIVLHLHMLLDGISVQRRIDPAFDMSSILRSFMAIVAAWSVPTKNPAELPPEVQMLGPGQQST